MRAISDALIGVIGRWLRKGDPTEPSKLCDFERLRYEVRAGDVLLVEGQNRVSQIIRQVTQSPWSHAALYLGRLHDIKDPVYRKIVKKNYNGPLDEQLIIESLMGSGTIIAPISKYTNFHIRICRPDSLSPLDAQKIVQFAVRRLGRKYHIRHILDLLRLLFPWSILPRRWRSTIFQHNAGKPTHEICSSMLAEAFHFVKYPILPYVKTTKDRVVEVIPRNPRLYTPSDFDYSPYFSIIKYPFVPLSHATAYQQLPWNEKGAYSNDEDGIYQPEETLQTRKGKQKTQDNDPHLAMPAAPTDEKDAAPEEK